MNPQDISANLNAVMAEANKESDRAAALLMAANLENRLKAILEAFFIEDIKADEIFEGHQAVAGGFYAKSLLCFSLGFLSKEEKRDLDLVRKIRNDFAHKEQGWSFQTQDVRNRCDQLILPTKMSTAGGLGHLNMTDPRLRYTLSCLFISAYLQSRVADILRIKRMVFPSYAIGPSSNAKPITAP
ncbi:MAG: hypothetical protein KA175_06880 [Flavobacteriales bacterium]|nr:hypothetical protein [Flavobacteriales bacterium]MBP6697324.1 hypothetical protein [Flavobacteriales bacterium]